MVSCECHVARARACPHRNRLGARLPRAGGADEVPEPADMRQREVCQARRQRSCQEQGRQHVAVAAVSIHIHNRLRQVASRSMTGARTGFLGYASVNSRSCSPEFNEARRADVDEKRHNPCRAHKLSDPQAVQLGLEPCNSNFSLTTVKASICRQACVSTGQACCGLAVVCKARCSSQPTRCQEAVCSLVAHARTGAHAYRKHEQHAAPFRLQEAVPLVLKGDPRCRRPVAQLVPGSGPASNICAGPTWFTDRITSASHCACCCVQH